MTPVSANAGEYKSVVGLDSIYVAVVTQDDSAAYVADTPQYFAPAAEATAEPTTNSETQYADNQPYDTMVSEGETAVALTVTGIPLEMLALVLGKVFDAASGRMWDNGSIPPDVALGFRAEKSNGSHRYQWFLKGKFSAPSEEAATKTDTPDPKTQQLTFTAIRTSHKWALTGSITDSVKRVVGDTDTDNFSATDFFASVQTPASTSVSALALSTALPADGASSVAVTANTVLTFNNALQAGAINGVVVVKADGTAVACVNTLDVTKKILTVNPSASLDASSTYIVAIGVTDIYGQTLNTAINFGTA
jgi:phi13 family phage major tail protein